MSRADVFHRWTSLPLLLIVFTVGCKGERAERVPAELAAGEKTGGLAVVCSQAALESLNPFVSPDLGAADMGLMLFTPLVLYGDDGAFRPYLATDWRWEDDGRRLILAIRRDVTWHDAAPLTAEDVAWTLRAAADPEYAYPGGPELASLEEVLVRDSVTVELRFAEPLVAGLEPFVALPILPRHLLADVPAAEFQLAEYHRSPIGSGPFRLAGSRVDGSILFDRAEGFPAELGRPFLDRLVFRPITEPTTIVAEMETRGVDLCITGSAMAEKLSSSGSTQVHSIEPVGIQTIFLNTSHAPLQDVGVRRALSAALRRAEIAAVVSPLASPAGNPLAPASPWIDPALAQPDGDSALAVSLLESAGWSMANGGRVRRDAQGRELQFTLLAPQQLETAMTVVQAQLRRVGVAVDLRFMEFASFVSTIMNPDSRPDAMALGLYESKLVRPDLYSILHSSGAQNLSSYSDPDVDSALERLGDVLSSDELREVYRDLQRHIAEDVPMIYTVYVPRLLAVGPRVRGVTVDPNGPFASVSEWWIPPTQRRR